MTKRKHVNITVSVVACIPLRLACLQVLQYCSYRDSPNVFCTDGAVEGIAWCVSLKLLFWFGTSDMLSRENWEACQISSRQGRGLRQPKSLTQQKRKEAPKLSHPRLYYDNTITYFALCCIIFLFLLGNHKSFQVDVTAFFMEQKLTFNICYQYITFCSIFNTFLSIFMSCSVNSNIFGYITFCENLTMK